MVRGAKAAVVGHVRDYKHAVSGFTHNASKYLRSGFLQGVGGGMLATVFGIYIKTAGMSESVVGTVEGAVAFTAAVVCLIGPPLVASVGYRVLMVAAISLIVLSRLGQAAFPVAHVVVGLALAFGLGDGFMRAIGSAFMSENSSKHERTHLFSTEFVIRVLAGFLGGLAGGLLPVALMRLGVAEVHAYQWTLTAGTLIVALGILPMLSLRDKRDREDEKFVARTFRDAYIDSLKHFTSWKHTVKLVGPQMFISLGGGLVIPFIPLYLKHQLGVDIGTIGIIQGLASVVLGFAAFGTPVIARRLGLVRGVALMQALSVPFLALVPFAGTIYAAVMLLWARGAVMNMAGPMYNQFSMEGVPDRDKPVVAGLMFFGLNMAWMVGSVAGGRMMTVSYTAPYTVAVFLYLSGAAATYLTWRGHDHTVGVPEPRTDEALPDAA
jgi:MFS family permease